MGRPLPHWGLRSQQDVEQVPNKRINCTDGECTGVNGISQGCPLVGACAVSTKCGTHASTDD
eukprot:1157509-Pelagomonas_calceolata.AAC.3